MLDERLGALLSDRSLSAFYADPRLEAFVPAEGEVVVLVQLRHPIRIDRADWAARVTAADDGRGLAALSWRVSQWQWVPEDTQDKGADDQGIGGEWALHPHSPIDAAAVFERLPEPLILWVHRWTEQAVDLFDELEADEPRSLPPPAG
jgi:hypothetical protein